MVRVTFSTALAALITISLLWVMHYLIATGVTAFSEEQTFRFVDFVRVQRDERTETKDTRIERPPEPQPPPPMQPERQLENFDAAGGTAIAISAPRVDHDVSLGRDGFFSDGEYMPIVQVAPQYPRRAAERGLEGHVLLEFTVTRQGTVRDPVVIDSSSSMFDRAAVDAVMRFRYRPRVIDGEPVEVPGVRFRITFQLED
ncbi:MAG TPA: energy transducer TonB [Gammaproteobacteria bacterium]|nr:energy transducer TonB [Gammaproteobacteria bacterium]